MESLWSHYFDPRRNSHIKHHNPPPPSPFLPPNPNRHWISLEYSCCWVTGGESGCKCLFEVVPGVAVQCSTAGADGDAETGDAPEPGFQLATWAHLLLLAGSAAAAIAAGHLGL